ncbi:hypothetical protein LIER_25626 [Lithospermum erythrorhizon]|uniref:Alginate lyase 2 domain-containing protein n=1 Tax=Lithospermum erythrorhizon TaxID=34254 RepID=A0AAV3R8P7_LITER
MKLSYISMFLVILTFEEIFVNICIADPIDGFTSVPFTLDLQKPYNKPIGQRYSNLGGVRRFWVFSNDKPFKLNTDTKPRTEAHVLGQDYTSGVHQFEGHVYIPRGTSGVSIMQIFGGEVSASTLQLRVYNGEIKRYREEVIESNVYNRWLRLNVIHNADEGQITIFINGVQKLEVADRGPGTKYFKFGVYTQNAPSQRMESRWRKVKIYKKM